jgi:mono/diheme cytochrome c family protein
MKTYRWLTLSAAISSRRAAGVLGVVVLLALPLSAADGLGAPGSPPSDSAASSGQALYLTYCSACHQANGEGMAGVFPPLRGSAVVNKADARKHIDIVLGGLQGARASGVTYTNPMPAFGATLSDEEIAAIIDYERGAWGNHGSLVGPAQVASARARLN